MGETRLSSRSGYGKESLGMQSRENDAILKVKAGIETAKQGQIELAREAAKEALLLSPITADVWHYAGVIFKLTGETSLALEHFDRALELKPDFHFSQVEIATIHQSCGNVDEAKRWLEKAIECAPDHIPAYRILAKLNKQKGDTREALRLLQTAMLIGSRDDDVLRDAVEILIWHSERGGAADMLSGVLSARPISPDLELLYIQLLTELARYGEVLNFCKGSNLTNNIHYRSAVRMYSGHARLAMAVNRREIIRDAEIIERSQAWLSPKDVYSTIQRSLETRVPFSLIRLGDGEARIFAYLESRNQKISIPQEESFAIGDLIWQNWFGESLDDTKPNDLERLSGEISRCLKGADVIGVPTSKRLKVDNLHFGYLAYLLNDLKEVTNIKTVKFADAFVNYELHRSDPFLSKLLSELDFIGVISPHSGLAEKLAARNGIKTRVSYVVPGEMRLPNNYGAIKGRGHFPGRFEEIIQQIEIPHKGAFFLVAAGILGKIYCQRVKDLGGIAIDIGAIADAWSGYETRPGQYNATPDWVLPY